MIDIKTTSTFIFYQTKENQKFVKKMSFIYQFTRVIFAFWQLCLSTIGSHCLCFFEKKKTLCFNNYNKNCNIRTLVIFAKADRLVVFSFSGEASAFRLARVSLAPALVDLRIDVEFWLLVVTPFFAARAFCLPCPSNTFGGAICRYEDKTCFLS